MKNIFGMFVHWGIHSILGQHEQALARLGMDNKEYEALASQFNPTEYDPEEWVLLAKEAGMKYICITAKHHDGFCMWDTKYTDYNIMNTPYGKDVLKMLADACAKHGMLLSIYYSNPDWNHENAFNCHSSHQWKCKNFNAGDMDIYREYVKNQVRELLTNYGPIYTWFWDIPTGVKDPSMNEFVRSLQPDILINDRGWADKGDFSTPEREVPDGERFERMTEACQAVGEQSWGYRADEDYYSVRFLMSSICKIMAMGGNYLLNVGPMATGKIDPKSAAMIRRIGQWYVRTEGILEDSDPEPCGIFIIRRNEPLIKLRKDRKTYLCYYQGLESEAVNLFHYPSVPKKARLMNDGRELRIKTDYLPNYFEPDGRASGPHACIKDIPVDEFALEPIIIEIEW
ncbi:MAG: alpha-L-fucosidase [Clostridia bacterium]|nr:alpha-L-fucosidase [Clostridia bacterium]